MYYALKYVSTGSDGTQKMFARVQAVANNHGFILKHGYASNNQSSSDWSKPIKTEHVNLTVDYCDPIADSCPTPASPSFFPTITFTGGDTFPQAPGQYFTITDHLGRNTEFSRASTQAYVDTPIDAPVNNRITATLDATWGVVTSWTDSKTTFYYYYSDAAGIRTTTVGGPSGSGYVRTYTSDANGRILSDKDALNRTTTYTYDGSGRLIEVKYPEGNLVRTSYDGRGNVLEVRRIDKTGVSNASDIFTGATYPTDCTASGYSAKNCNKPLTTTDERGKVTNYTWSSVHGGLLTIELPAPTSGGTRPKTTYTYTALQAYVKNSSGVRVATGQSIYKLTGTSTCSTGTSCAGTSTEVKTTITYQAGSASARSNLFVTKTATGFGSGAMAETTYAYDQFGNVVQVDGPLAGTGDLTKYRYDQAMQLVGSVGSDPDGAGGAGKLRAVRTTYDADGQVTAVERGTYERGTSTEFGVWDDDVEDSTWAGFTALEKQTAEYDSAHRLIKQTLVTGGTTRAVTQYSYDLVGRVSCTAQRMNPAEFATLTTDACALDTEGTAGPDRITKVTYNAAGQVLTQVEGFGTTAAVTSVTYTYGSSSTSNGTLQTVADGRGRLTTYLYDGFDRVGRIVYPYASGAAGSDPNLYEQITYDKASNVTNVRTRMADFFNYTYDDLNRVTLQQIDLDGSGANPPDVSYTYDNLGRMLSARKDQASEVRWTYDAWGNPTKEEQAVWSSGTSYPAYQTQWYQYDLAGNRTRLTWQDGLYIQYDYNIYGEMTVVRENGATSGVGVLAAYTYDDLGRRTWLYRGNGANTAYTWTPLSRLASIAFDLADPNYDDTKTFTYNPAGQITKQAFTKGVYQCKWTSDVNTSGSVNGLNQLVTMGSNNFGHAPSGNTTGIGPTGYAASFTYDAENRLVATTQTPGAVLSYDALGRLLRTDNNALAATRFGHDGAEIAAEYNDTGTMLRRYVKGAGADETLVWYEGTGTTDRRFLVADERGSILTVTASTGTILTTNTYDEYGKPGTANAGRFQYTGQAWIPEAEMYYYKARFYHPTHGRFTQPDPIGYADGLNLYAYVGGDPINMIDPGGLIDGVPCTTYEDFTCTYVRGTPPFGMVDATGIDLAGSGLVMSYFAGGFETDLHIDAVGASDWWQIYPSQGIEPVWDVPIIGTLLYSGAKILTNKLGLWVVEREQVLPVPS